MNVQTEGEVTILETEPTQTETKVSMTVSIFEAVVKEGEKIPTKGSCIHKIECSHDGKVVNHKGLVNKFTTSFANFQQLVKQSKINKKAFFFESEINTIEGKTQFKSTTAFPVNNLTKLSFAMGLLITGFNNLAVDHFEGTLQIDEPTRLFLQRVFGDNLGTLLADGGNEKAIQNSFKAKANIIKLKEKFILSEVDFLLLKNNPSLIPVERAKIEDKLSNAKIEQFQSEGKLQDYISDLGEADADGTIQKGGVEVLKKAVEVANKKVEKLEAQLSGFDAKFSEVLAK